MQALSCVRKSRKVRQLLTTKTAMLENMQHILHQIQMAETNAMVYKSHNNIYTTAQQDYNILCVSGAACILQRYRGPEGHAEVICSFSG